MREAVSKMSRQNLTARVSRNERNVHPIAFLDELVEVDNSLVFNQLLGYVERRAKAGRLKVSGLAGLVLACRDATNSPVNKGGAAAAGDENRHA